MSATEVIRAAIVATLAAVPGIGIVHGRERYAANRTALRDLYVAPGSEQLLGWYVRRARFSATRSGARDRTVRSDWEISGYMALADADASEQQFDTLIDAIAAAIQANQTLGGTVTTTIFEDGAGIALTQSGPVMFAGVLCHSADLKLRTQHTEHAPR